MSKTMELTVTTQAAVITANFDELREQLQELLTEYDFVVTADTVKDAKTKATEVNKLKGKIDTKRKEIMGLISEPARAFDTEAKSLVGICEDARRKILDQVSKFENETLELALTELTKFRDELYKKHSVDEEFRTVDVTDLKKLTAITGKGALTKQSKETVAARVNECVMKQQNTALRLSQLENDCHRAGLLSPLTREHVEGILFQDEATYRQNLEKLVARELERQEEALEKKAAEIAKGTIEAMEAVSDKTGEGPEALESPAQKVETQSSAPVANTATRTVANNGSTSNPEMEEVSVTCSFVIKIKPGFTDQQIELALRNKLEKADIRDSLQSVTIERSSKHREAA